MSFHPDPITVEDVLTPEETAELLRSTPAALAQMRYAGRGPVFVKHGRMIRYLRSDIADYLTSNRHDRTDKRVRPHPSGQQ